MWRQRNVGHHPRLFKTVLLCRTANGDDKGKVFFNGCWGIRNCQGSLRPRLAGRGIERKLRLNRILGELSTPSSVGIKTLSKFPAPGNVLFQLRGDAERSLGMSDAACAKIDALPYGNIQVIFPNRRNDRQG